MQDVVILISLHLMQVCGENFYFFRTCINDSCLLSFPDWCRSQMFVLIIYHMLHIVILRRSKKKDKDIINLTGV